MSQQRVLRSEALSETAQLAWLGRLIGANTPQAVAAAVVALAQAQPGCAAAILLWMDVASGTCRSTAAESPDQKQIEWMQTVLGGEQEVQASADGYQLILRLASGVPAVLQLSMRDASMGSHLCDVLAPCLQLAGQHMQHALAMAKLHDSHHQLERSENLQRALFAISDLAGSDLDMPELLRGIHGIVSTLMYAENFYIVRHDPERRMLRFLYYADTVDLQGPDTTREESLEGWLGTLTWHLLTTGRSLMGSAEELREQVEGLLITLGPDSFDWLGVPMLREGQVHGALVVQSYQQGIGFSDEDSALLAFVGSHILTALERKQTKDELEQHVRLRTQELDAANRGLQQEVLERQRAEHLQEALFQLAQLATADIDESAFYQRVHAVVGRLLDAENFFIALLTEDRRRLDFPYYVDSGVRHTLTRPLGRGLSEYVLRQGQPWLGGSQDIAALQRSGEVVPHQIGDPATCWLGVPLWVGEEAIGLVAVQSYASEVSYGMADQELLSFAALQIANSIYRRRSAASLQQANQWLEQRVEERTRELREQIARREHVQQQLKHQVVHDPLTGLPNRDFLRERMDRVLVRLQAEQGRCCALLYLDVDRFKVINDSLGHLAGDAFLKAVASRLMHCVHEPDVVARLSGDEFAILLEDIDTPAMAEKVAQHVLRILGEPLLVAGRELEPSASMGIAIGNASYDHADALLRDADIALYRAKALGRKRYALFDETLAKNAVDVLMLEVELRHALQHDEFEPYFQPIIRLETEEVVGYEALLRWNHPHRGVLCPADFLRIAQDSGHIEAIDWRLFAHACRCFVQMNRPDMFMTFNVSPLHLRHADFDHRLLQLLDRTQLPPSQLIIEITEGALLDDPERAQEILERLRHAGVNAALDDFGTGYSSLSHLHSLPLNKLKIDRVFVQALEQGTHDSATVVAAILALAHALNIGVIAEGIETVAQREALLAMGCEYGQGYLMGRPAPISHWLTDVARELG